MKDSVEIITLKKDQITDFAKERNILLSKAKKDWVFFVDSDEEVTKKLEEEISRAVKDKGVQGYYVIRKDFMFGRELKHGEFSSFGRFGNSKILRLARKNAGKWKRPVHEFWDIKGRTKVLKNPLLHYPHKDLSSFISNINRFSILHAKALSLEGKKSSLLKIIVWPVGKFFYNLILRLGFLDGMEGFVVGLIMSFHSFLSWSNLYLWQRKYR